VPAAARVVELGGLWTLLRAFLEWGEVRGYSQATIEGRRRDLMVFIRWAHDRNVTEWRDVERATLEQFQRWLFHAQAHGKDQPLSTRTQMQRLTSLQAMFRYLVKHKHVPANPAADLELPRIVARLPKNALSIDEVESVMRVPDVTHPMGLRLRAILEVFYSTGLRRAELAQLLVGDVDFNRSTVYVRHGKGGKDRLVPIGERALSWVKKYLHDVRPLFVVDASQQALFVTNSGDEFRLSRLGELVTDAIKRAELGKVGSCHMLRHTMATLMLEGGADTRYIQAMLGHADASTTSIYTHVAIGKLQEVHRLSHPARPQRTSDDVDTPTP
jgi:integrase/recombinase XerD